MRFCTAPGWSRHWPKQTERGRKTDLKRSFWTGCKYDGLIPADAETAPIQRCFRDQFPFGMGTLLHGRSPLAGDMNSGPSASTDTLPAASMQSV